MMDNRASAPPSNSQALVSVIIPAYNAEPFIRATLASVLSQTYKNIEVLVVDDGSTDHTAEIVQTIADRDCRVSLLRSSNNGVAAARNLAIQNSVGEYIAPLDADDIWYSQKLARQMEYFDSAGSEVGLVYGWSVVIDESGQLTGAYIAADVEGHAFLSLVYSNFIGNASAPLVRRSCLDHVGGYDGRYVECDAQGGEDHDLYLRIAEHYRFGVVREFLVGYRQIKGSMSSNVTSMAKANALLLSEVRRRHPALPERFYRWAKSHAYEYLARKCNYSGDRWGALRWFSRAVALDPGLLWHRRLYALEIRNLIGLSMRPVLGSVREHLSRSNGAGRGRHAVAGISIADIEQRRNSHTGSRDLLAERRQRYLCEMEGGYWTQ
ncbi:MAG TPA: glycosyltransferase family A protein [Opitutales bacterium]|nr:glycosyltransferase family A protein [Opitutales bacterium]